MRKPLYDTSNKVHVFVIASLSDENPQIKTSLVPRPSPRWAM